MQSEGELPNMICSGAHPMRALAIFAALMPLPTPTAAADAIHACEPSDGFFVEYRRSPCGEDEDGERIDTVTPEGVGVPHRAVLERADLYYREHVFGGQALSIEEWFTQEALVSLGLREALPGAITRSQAHAEKHGGFATIEFEVTGALEDLVAANVFVEFGDGRIDKQTSCWKLQDSSWKFHSSCLEIALRQDDLSESEEEALHALQKLIEGEP